MLKKQNDNKKNLQKSIINVLNREWQWKKFTLYSNQKFFFSDVFIQFFFIENFITNDSMSKRRFVCFWRKKLTKNNSNSWNNDSSSKKSEEISILKKRNWSLITSAFHFSVQTISISHSFWQNKTQRRNTESSYASKKTMKNTWQI